MSSPLGDVFLSFIKRYILQNEKGLLYSCSEIRLMWVRFPRETPCTWHHKLMNSSEQRLTTLSSLMDAKILCLILNRLKNNVKYFHCKFGIKFKSYCWHGQENNIKTHINFVLNFVTKWCTKDITSGTPKCRCIFR